MEWCAVVRYEVKRTSLRCFSSDNHHQCQRKFLQVEGLPAEANSAGSTSAPVEETPLFKFLLKRCSKCKTNPLTHRNRFKILLQQSSQFLEVIIMTIR